ncbi:MAG: glycosyltransferase [Verrucomicrobiae bacterium]|nr:glycosyltransferase [Verrucomicrobiae bacterium]
MDFSIITPSFRNGQWLRLCIASVADQEGVSHEHIVQDGGSDDGTLDWLIGERRVRVFVEKDCGMYDAINRGLKRAQGELLAYLNCDEQYLPGALAAVKEFFAAHPQTEVVFADTVVVDADGRFVAYRKAIVPCRAHVWVSLLPTPSCAMFFRRSIITQRKLFFDANWRCAGDAAWMLKLLDQGVRMAVLRRYTSAFTSTGGNLGSGQEALQEKKLLRATAPRWMRVLAPWWVVQHRLRKWWQGCYRQEPFAYEIYTLSQPDRRTRFEVAHPSFRW